MSATATLPRSTPAHIPQGVIFDFDIYADPRITDDVQGSYAKALENAPDIFFTPANGGHWIIRRAEMITAIVKDPEHFSVREMQIPRVENPPFFIPLSLDPPKNIPYRMALSSHLSPKAVKAMEPKLRDWARKIVGEVAPRGECDFVYDVSALYPVSIFMEMMGMDLGRLREFRIKADKFFNSRTAEEYGVNGGAIQADMLELVQSKRRHPGDDLVSKIWTTEVEGRPISEDEVMSMAYILFLGGMDTVTNVAGFAFKHLSSDPALRKRLRDNPERIADFVEESLRMFSVVSTPRLVVKSCERFGVTFTEGEMVLCSLSEGGRDERLHPNPNVFDIDRKSFETLTFSAGPHLCVGHLLARAEIRILTEEWLKAIPEFRAKPGMKHGFRIGTVHGLESLPLEWTVAKA